MFIWLHDRLEDAKYDLSKISKFLKRVNWAFAAVLLVGTFMFISGFYFWITKIF
jgi:hypothetical protein